MFFLLASRRRGWSLVAGAVSFDPLALGTALCAYSLVVGMTERISPHSLHYLPFAGPGPLPTFLLVQGIFLLTGFAQAGILV